MRTPMQQPRQPSTGTYAGIAARMWHGSLEITEDFGTQYRIVIDTRPVTPPAMVPAPLPARPLFHDSPGADQDNARRPYVPSLAVPLRN